MVHLKECFWRPGPVIICAGLFYFATHDPEAVIFKRKHIWLIP